MKPPPTKLKLLRKYKKNKELKADVVKLLSNSVRVVEDEIKKEGYWKQFIAKTDIWERVLHDIVVEQFVRQRDKVFANIEGKKSKDDIGKYLFNLLKETEVWTKEIEPVLTEIIQEQGRYTMDFLGLSDDIDVTQENVVAYLEEASGVLIRGINETTLKLLRETLAEGVKENEGIPALKQRVSDVFISATGPRAEKIARTEVLRASNFGTNEAYEQSGLVEEKEWLTAFDERTCPICEAMDGKKVGLHKDFKVGGVGNVDYPPAHPNCRCTIVPIVK